MALSYKDYRIILLEDSISLKHKKQGSEENASSIYVRTGNLDV